MAGLSPLPPWVAIMLKSLDFAATETRARAMSSAELHYARTDARETAEIWDRAGDQDHDRNAGFYRDEATVYAQEQKRRTATA